MSEPQNSVDGQDPEYLRLVAEYSGAPTQETLAAVQAHAAQVVAYVAANAPTPPEHLKQESEQAYYDWATQAVLAWYDEGRVDEAVMLFIGLMYLDQRMQPVLQHPSFDVLLPGMALRGRSEFAAFLAGFKF